MKIPDRLIPLVEDGIIEEVIGQVKSGKEADVFVVRVGEELRCAKVYKDANNRSFRQAVQYQEGRKVRNSRDARAIGKRSRYGQREAESSWINAEVEALNTLSAAGLRVPRPFGFFDGVLIMELVMGEDGEPAPRLNDITLSADTAFLYHEEMIAQIVRMLCCGIIHGDLSEFNVLVDADGPVIIDLPQAVNAAGNNSAPMLFARDVDNMARYFGRFAPEILGLKYAKEIWALYEKGKLTPHVELTGQYQEPTRRVDVGGVLDAIGDARREHEDRGQKRDGRNGTGYPGRNGSSGSNGHPGRSDQGHRNPGYQPGPGSRPSAGNPGSGGNAKGGAGGYRGNSNSGQGGVGSRLDRGPGGYGNPRGNPRPQQPNVRHPGPQSGNRQPGGGHAQARTPEGKPPEGKRPADRPDRGGHGQNRPDQDRTDENRAGQNRTDRDRPQWGRRNAQGRPRQGG